MSVFDYDRRRCAEYALRWAYRRNPLFYDFSDIGGDCTNFVSQCIFAGCCRMNFSETLGWYYISPEMRAPSWTGVEFLYEFLTSESDVGPFASVVEEKYLRTGDVIQLANADGDYYHTLAVIARSDKDILVASHSIDSFARPLSTYSYSSLRALHIEGYRSDGDMCDCFDALYDGTRLETCFR